MPSSCPSRSDINKAFIETNDTIVFPDKYKVLEEVFQTNKKNNCYNGCFKFSHADILIFVVKNKLEIKKSAYDSSEFRPFSLLKNEQPELRAMPELSKKDSKFYADTIEDKLYIYKRY